MSDPITISPKAQAWVNKWTQENGGDPGRFLSQIIEGYMELEESVGGDGVKNLLQAFVHAPKEAAQKIDSVVADARDFNERARVTLDTIRLFCAQLHATRTLGDNGHPQYQLPSDERQNLYPDEPGEEQTNLR